MLKAAVYLSRSLCMVSLLLLGCHLDVALDGIQGLNEKVYGCDGYTRG